MPAAIDPVSRATPAASSGVDVATGAAVGSLALGTFGAAFSWKLDRLPRLAAASALTGMLAGGIGGAILASDSPIGDPTSRLQGAAGVGLLGAGGGALLVAGLAGIIAPPMTTITRLAAMREFALYGALAGGAIGAAAGALQQPRA